MKQTKIIQFSDDLRAAILVESPVFDKTEINLKNQLELNDAPEEHLLNQWQANQQRIDDQQRGNATEEKSNCTPHWLNKSNERRHLTGFLS